MDNKEIIRQIELYASVLELQGEEAFKLRAYQNAVFNLEKLEQPLSGLSLQELEKLPGVGKAIAAKIDDANKNGVFHQLRKVLEEVPAGVIDMLSIDGLGPKKIQIIWKEMGIEDTDQLLQACENNQLAETKGFGQKTQENIKNALLFHRKASGQAHYATAEKQAASLEIYLKEELKGIEFCTVGQVRRKLEIVDEIQLIAVAENPDKLFDALDRCAFLQKNEKACGIFAWRGTFKENHLKIEVRIAGKDQYTSEVFVHSASEKHLAYRNEESGLTLMQLARKQTFVTETALYESAGLPYITPELREGYREFEWAKANLLPEPLQSSDVKGILHAHSTYSDGKHSLEAMAQHCKELGYEYLGITDHSKSAFYANGLQEFKIKEQHDEIDRLNEKLAPFKIFKGIESDILSDGSLDYAPEVLASFDFIIVSIHTALKMDANKATERLIRAIENPYTTILGHPSGRLLLAREGYPLHYSKIIDACAANGVCIEINASPWRLDLDWRWVYEALEKGVWISINPDAHEKDTVQDVYYGVCVGRKAGLTREKTLNAKNVAEMEHYFQQKKKRG